MLQDEARKLEPASGGCVFRLKANFVSLALPALISQKEQRRDWTCAVM
ncbi:hypothetical protein TRICHSKD4_5804 [Roseibium sp. TrichSKD4]|nr:hypothetical protein TRICHSKD4_5804 [Roseibium sp. TrichSKD4]